MTLIRLPIAFGGRLDENFALTAPLLPCGLVILPQITLILDLFSCPGQAVRLNKTNNRSVNKKGTKALVTQISTNECAVDPL